MEQMNMNEGEEDKNVDEREEERNMCYEIDKCAKSHQ